MPTKVAFLGTGNMGSALIVGALRSRVLRPNQIAAYDLDKARLKRLARETRIQTASSLADAHAGANFVFLCVKPQQMAGLVASIRDAASAKQCFISIAAGVPLAKLERGFGGRIPVIRAMPNTPAMIGSGMTAIAKGRKASAAQVAFAERFFSAVGAVAVLPEKHFDAVTAVSGSGPAYLFYLAEALECAARKLGLPPEVAGLLAKQTLMGSGKMLLNAAAPEELRRRVTSPGGTTESAVRFLEGKRWKDVFEQAVRRARDRSRELSR